MIVCDVYDLIRCTRTNKSDVNTLRLSDFLVHVLAVYDSQSSQSPYRSSMDLFLNVFHFVVYVPYCFTSACEQCDVFFVPSVFCHSIQCPYDFKILFSGPW